MVAAVCAAEEQPVAAETAVFGAGCFWCVEAIYQQQPGVLGVVSGFAGGRESEPNYDDVVAGKTGHAEVIRVEFDPAVVSYRELVDLFWQTHDPTDPRGVWPDFGPHYRSIILYGDERQHAEVLASKEEAQAGLAKPIATEIAPLTEFYPAEQYHQDFARKNPDHPYVRTILLPKLKKLGLEMP